MVTRPTTAQISNLVNQKSAILHRTVNRLNYDNRCLLLFSRVELAVYATANQTKKSCRNTATLFDPLQFTSIYGSLLTIFAVVGVFHQHLCYSFPAVGLLVITPTTAQMLNFIINYCRCWSCDQQLFSFFAVVGVFHQYLCYSFPAVGLLVITPTTAQNDFNREPFIYHSTFITLLVCLPSLLWACSRYKPSL